MDIKRAKNTFIVSSLAFILSVVVAIVIYYSGFGESTELLIAAFLGLSCGLLPLMINLTKAGVLMAIIKDAVNFFKDFSKKVAISTKSHDKAAA